MNLLDGNDVEESLGMKISQNIQQRMFIKIINNNIHKIRLPDRRRDS